MKKFLTLLVMAFALTAFANEPSQPTKAPDGMMLAKKKDHSKDKKEDKKDKKVDATKSPADKKAAKDDKPSKSK